MDVFIVAVEKRYGCYALCFYFQSLPVLVVNNDWSWLVFYRIFPSVMKSKLLSGVMLDGMIFWNDVWDMEVLVMEVVLSCMLKASCMITISDVEKDDSKSDIVMFWFFLQLCYLIRISCRLCVNICPTNAPSNVTFSPCFLVGAFAVDIPWLDVDSCLFGVAILSEICVCCVVE